MTAWVVGVDETILKTTGGGMSWRVLKTSVPNAGPHVNGVCAFDSLSAWIAVDHDVMSQTVDGGTTFSEFKIPPSVGDGYHLICVSATDEDTLWVTGVSFTASRPFGSHFHDNGGFHWVRQQIPVDTMLRRISFVGSPK
jgi:hypothetical protein